MKKAMKVLCLVLTVVLGISIFAGCSSPAAPAPESAPAAAPAQDAAPAAEPEAAGSAEAEYVFRFGLPVGGKHPNNYLSEKFAEILPEVSGGRVAVELYPAGQLGTTAQMIESILNGSLQGLALPVAYMTNMCAECGVLEMPFLFDYSLDTEEQTYRILNSGTSLDEALYNAGFAVGGWPLSGTNYIMSTSAINTKADFAGKKIRCHTSEYVQASLNDTGAVATMVDTGELSTALQNGTIDGLETDIAFAYSQKMYELAPYFNLLPMVGSPAIFTVSAEWLESVPEDIRAFVMEAAQKACEAEAEYYRTYNKECLDAMVAAGVTVVEPSEELIADLKASTAGVAEKFKTASEKNAKVYEEFIALIEADSAANK